MKTNTPVPVSIHNLGSIGVVKDSEPHTLPPEAWSDARNVRFSKRGVARIAGHTVAIAAPAGVPQFILSVPGILDTAWIYCSSVRAYAYMSGVSTEITRLVSGSPSPYLTLKPHDWNGVLFAGIPILNNQADPPQWWANISPGQALANLPNWPANTTAKVLVAFGSYLFALNITESGVNKPHMVWWSHKADPGTIPTSWNYADPTVDAARLELTDTEGGDIVDALMLGSQLIIYKQKSTHAIRFVGGDDLFSPDKILDSSGILTSKCVTAFGVGQQHFVVTDNDVIIHSGTKDATSIADTIVKDALFKTIDSTNYYNSFVFDNPSKKEVWFCYPEGGATFPTVAAIWGYGSGNRGWTFRDFTGCCVDTGKFSVASPEAWDTGSEAWDASTDLWAEPGVDKTLFGDNVNSKIYMLDSGTTFDGQTPPAYLIRVGLAITGRDRTGAPKVDFNIRKAVTRVWPKLSSGMCNIRLGSQDTEKEEVFWTDPVLFDASIDKYADLVANGRLIAIRFDMLTAEAYLSGYDLELVPDVGGI